MPLDEPLQPGLKRPWLGWRQHVWRAQQQWRRHGRERLYQAFVSTPLVWPAAWFVWVPTLLIIGVALYFSLSVEPPAWLGPLGVGLSLLVMAAFARGSLYSQIMRWAAVACLCL
ncbi:MAG: hypothetical protein AAF213_12125, partial [Pseudomonadota bacterium]